MSTRRLRKQITYALIWLALPTLIIMAIVTIKNRDPAPKATPTPVAYIPIEVKDTVVITQSNPSSLESTTVDLVTSLRNPNARAGISEYPVQYTVFSSAGEEIAKASETIHLLPGSTQYAMALNVTIPAEKRLGRLEVSVPSAQEVVFTEIPDLGLLPSFSVFLRQRTDDIIAGRPSTTQKGVITNTGAFDWEKVEVRVVALNQDGQIIAAGKTFVGRLITGQQREFSTAWPKVASDITQIVALPSTNIFREDNIVEIIGDPSRLR